MPFLKKTAKNLLAFVKNRWKLLLLVLVILGGIAFWQYRKTQAARPQLTFVKPITQNLTQTLEVSGLIDAKQKARLRFAAGGKVTYLGAKEGELIKKWQTIARIDQATLQKQLQQDLNNFAKERLDWDQTLDNTRDQDLDGAPGRAKDKDQYDLNNTVLNVEIQDIAIKNTALSAPFAGVLTALPTTVTGVNILATDYFELVNPETLIFKAAVDETDIARVRLAQSATLNLDAYPDDTTDTYVEYVAFTSTQGASGTVFVVEFPLDDRGLEYYRLGMNGDITIITDTRENVLSIPLDALRERDDKSYVDVRTGEFTYEEREIETGLETDDQVEVISGLSENDEILLPE